MARLNDEGEVRAAGGIVTQVRADVIFVLMVYRGKFADWSLPKGKVKRGEADQDAALREVQEETGLQCTLGDEAGSMHYVNRAGQPKVSRYWLMAIECPGRLRFDNEVDAARWFTLSQARNAATRSGDRDFLTELSKCIVARGSTVAALRQVHIWEGVRGPSV